MFSKQAVFFRQYHNYCALRHKSILFKAVLFPTQNDHFSLSLTLLKLTYYCRLRAQTALILSSYTYIKSGIKWVIPNKVEL